MEITTAAGGEQHPALAVELITPGVATKFIVVIQQEDACNFAGLLLIEQGGSQTADTRTHHYQVVFLVEVLIAGRFLPVPSQGMGGFKSTVVITANARQRRRIIVAGDCRC